MVHRAIRGLSSSGIKDAKFWMSSNAQGQQTPQTPLQEVWAAGLAFRQRYNEPGETRQLTGERLRLVVQAFTQGVQGQPLTVGPLRQELLSGREVEKEVKRLQQRR